MSPLEIRDGQHGTTTGYRNGCRCVACCGEASRHRRAWREANRDKVLLYEATRDRSSYRADNRGYLLTQNTKRSAQYQAESLVTAVRRGPWQPHEDALLARIPSDVSAASALGRTFRSVRSRRRKLRAKGLLP